MSSLKTPREVPPNIDEHLAIWVRCHRAWSTCHYLLGILSTLFSITVASQPEGLKEIPRLMSILSWLSAICVGLMTFLLPMRRARSYVKAARVLTDARNRYRHESAFTIEQLLNAVRDGEEHISKSED